MASFGANFTSVDADELPSIFEVLAQESLVASLKPALQHLFRVLAENNPSRYGWLYALGDEVFAFMSLILENHYLRNYSSSFAENFYGLKRVPTSCLPDDDDEEEEEGDGGSDSTEEGGTDGEESSTAGSTSSSMPRTTDGLPRSEHIRSLLFLVLVPYLKNKCDEAYERLHEEAQYSTEEENKKKTGFKHKLVRAFLGCYPVIHVLWEGSIFAFTMAYIIGKSKYHSPFTLLSGTILANLTEDDMEDQENGAAKQPLDLTNKSVLRKVSLVLNRGLGGAAYVMATGMSVGVFFLQFLEWWHESDQHAASLTALPTPHPPSKEHDVCTVPNTVCPLCQRIRTNDTVLANTGYVFCYPCIYKYVTENQSCPVTGVPSQGDCLVKLYLEE